MTIKWNWGTGIFLAYTGFVIFMLGMVYLCTRQHFDLVTEDYYAQELKFQKVIDGKNNENLLDKQTEVVIDAEKVTITLPMEQIDVEGQVLFYKPDNSKYDLVVPFAGKSQISVPVSKLQSGLYKVKATWTFQGKPYYNEQTLYVP